MTASHHTHRLANKTILITGGSRGIGRAIALKCAADGANVIIAAKTVEPHPKLAGTIHSVAAEIEALGGKALPMQVDVRYPEQLQAACQQAAEQFGGIDIVINNASALHVGNVETTEIKHYDLIQTVNHRATFLAVKAALPYLKKSTQQPHILTLSPPVNMAPKWLGMLGPYAVSKYGMTLLTLGMAEEFKTYGIACNTLWPATYIATDAVAVHIGKDAAEAMSRKPDIMADAAYAIISGQLEHESGQSYIDEEVLKRCGLIDLSIYACQPEHADKLAKDFFVD